MFWRYSNKKPPQWWLFVSLQSVTETVSISRVANRVGETGRFLRRIPDVGVTSAQCARGVVGERSGRHLLWRYLLQPPSMPLLAITLDRLQRFRGEPPSEQNCCNTKVNCAEDRVAAQILGM